MHSYHIYLIKDDVARHYFGKENKLFQLFNEYHSATDKYMIDVIWRQICYISQPVDRELMDERIYRLCHRMRGYSLTEGCHCLRNNKNTRAARLNVGEREIVVQAEETGGQELTFFEILRQCDSHFLAVDFEQRSCAWLNPVKNAEFLRSKVDLVSHDSVH